MQHASLTPERWASFGSDRQLLMIANEMNRASKLLASGERQGVKNAYERVLRLVDLTVMTCERRGLRRELLRWRDLIAVLYVSKEPDPRDHDDAFLALLRLTPATAQQIPFVTMAEGRPSERRTAGRFSGSRRPGSAAGPG